MGLTTENPLTFALPLPGRSGDPTAGVAAGSGGATEIATLRFRTMQQHQRTRLKDRELDDTDAAMIAAIVAGANTQDAAQAAGISARAGYARYAKPLFKATLAEKRGEQWTPIATKFRTNVAVAIDVILNIMNDVAQKASDRLMAAKSVVDYARQFAEDTEIRPAIAALQMAESFAAEDLANESVSGNDQTDVE